MFFNGVESVFFIKDVSDSEFDSFYVSSFDDLKSAFMDFVEWLIDEDFSSSRIEEYISKAKEKGYNRVVLPNKSTQYYGYAENILEKGMMDKDRVFALWETTDGLHECCNDVGRLQLYKLVSVKEGQVEDSVMYITDESSIRSLDSYVKNNFNF